MEFISLQARRDLIIGCIFSFTDRWAYNWGLISGGLYAGVNGNGSLSLIWTKKTRTEF